VPLAKQNTAVLQAIGNPKNDLNPNIITRIWEDCLQAPDWYKSPAWTHGDLLPANFLIQQKRLSAVIDFGLMGIGDPACDLIPAWSFLTGESRALFREKLTIDEATWIRGRGWALSTALIILPYYRNTNPGLTAVASKIISEILSEL
jgi:aminoglycoside phosphotransferase (APT) family kinase protein